MYKTCLLISLLSNYYYVPIQYRLLSRILLCSKSFPNTNSHKKKINGYIPNRQARLQAWQTWSSQCRWDCLLTYLCAFSSIPVFAVSDGSTNQWLYTFSTTWNLWILILATYIVCDSINTFLVPECYLI